MKKQTIIISEAAQRNIDEKSIEGIASKRIVLFMTVEPDRLDANGERYDRIMVWASESAAKAVARSAGTRHERIIIHRGEGVYELVEDSVEDVMILNYGEDEPVTMAEAEEAAISAALDAVAEFDIKAKRNAEAVDAYVRAADAYMEAADANLFAFRAAKRVVLDIEDIDDPGIDDDNDYEADAKLVAIIREYYERAYAAQHRAFFDEHKAAIDAVVTAREMAVSDAARDEIDEINEVLEIVFERACKERGEQAAIIREISMLVWKI